MDTVKNEDFLSLEKCFSMIKQSIGVKENLVKVETILNRIFGFSSHVSIVENTSSFFGVNIYPSIATMDKLIENIVSYDKGDKTPYSIWSENDTWYIEIDSLLCSYMSVNANPSEIVALLLHEIGKDIYSDIIPRRLNKLISQEVIKLRYNIRQLIESEKIRKLFYVAVIEACTVDTFRYIENGKAIPVDKIIVDYGYADDMNELIDKIIKTHGNSLINKENGELEKDVSNIVTWCINNIKELEFKKSGLREALKVEILRTPSPFIKRAIQHIHVSFFGDVTDKYRELLSEQFSSVPRDIYQELKSEQILIEHVHRVLTESVKTIFDKNGKLKKITQSDIDILSVEAERIDTTDDKIYLLDKLYRQLDLINIGLDYIESGDKNVTPRITQSKPTLLNMKKQLEELREQIIATRIIEKDYGVFIKYPKGYQG